ncbi:MAG: phage tail tube protein [Proteobacteria bacterium]|nr:phage tail tube protein [Pseudomonadota bacterium]MBU1594265.1 phage tail tube protein [Pseudomonadota bacterium]
MAGNKRAGTLYLKIDGVQREAKGEFTYDIGGEKREAIVGADTVHGYKTAPRVPFIEGAITDSKELNLKTLQGLDGVTVTLELANGKTIVLSNAWFAGEGTVKTGEAEIPVRFEAAKGEES